MMKMQVAILPKEHRAEHIYFPQQLSLNAHIHLLMEYTVCEQ